MDYLDPGYPDYLTRKLAHYNVWLMDRRKVTGTRYPGFPEDEGVVPLIEESPEPVKKKRSTAKAVKAASAPLSRMQTAIDLFVKYEGSKADVIAGLVKIGMTPAGASTYFYNARRGQEPLHHHGR